MKIFLKIISSTYQKLIVLLISIASLGVLDLIGLFLITRLFEIFEKSEKSITILETEIPFNSFVAGVFIYYVFKYFISVIINKNIISFTQSTELTLRKKLFRTIINLDYLDYIKKESGDYIYLITELSKAYANGFIMPIIRLINDLILLIFVSIYFFVFDYKLFLITLIFFIIIVFIYEKIYKRDDEGFGQKSADLSSEIIGLLSSVFTGFKEMVINNESNFFIKRFDKLTSNYKLNYEKYLLSTVLPKIYYDLVVFTYLLIFVIYLFVLDIQNAFLYISTLGVIAFKILPIIITLTNAFIQINFNKVAFYKIHNYLKNYDSLANNISFSKSIKKIEKISIKDLNFKYSKNIIIENANVDFKKGKIYGLIGESGSGKTTLLDLISGLIKSNQDQIKFYDNESRVIPLKENISYLPQNPFVFNGTFEENITLANTKYSKKLFEDSIVNSQLSDLWNSFKENKLYITENGKNLSGGQRQRLGFARILYMDKDILLLDEFTSALDIDVTMNILKYVSSIKKNKIIIITAHDPKVLSI